MKKHIISSICLLFLLATAAGCPEDNTIQPRFGYAKEEIIGVLLESYDSNRTDLYKGLLHEDYVWILQEGDYEPGEEGFISRELDIQITRNMFDAAKGEYYIPVDRLSLALDDGQWAKVDSIAGEPCSDCWMTERRYYILIGIGETTYLADDIIHFYIAPAIEHASEQYRIIQAVDIDRRSLATESERSVTTESWGALKMLFSE